MTGTGASGTWGISITGNANTATSAGDSTNLGGRSSSRYLYYRGYSTSGDFQTLQSTESIIRFDQVGEINSWSNAPSGVYTYGGVLSLRGDNFGLQIYGSHIGDLVFKTQWNNDQYSGWRNIIHSGNIGSQSVSYATSAGNADTVDGFHASVAGTANTIPTRNANGYLIPENWIQLNGIYGLYSPTNNAHLRPNPHSYGPWLVTGTRNGWNGIEFDASNGNVSLMVNPNSNTTGFHNNSYGWQFYWEGGTLYCSKNAYGAGTNATVLDSVNFTNYAWPLEGGWKPASLASSTRLRGATSPDGGEFALAYSGGQIHPYADGFFYQNEGAYRVIDTNSVGSYAPTLTGGGASGSWGISITGSAGGVSWANVSSKPAAWLDATNLIQGREPNTIGPSGFYESYLGSGNPTGTWMSYINVRHNNPDNGHGFQIGMSFYDNNLWFRSYSGAIAATFQSWAYAISSQNIGSQSVNYASSAGTLTNNATISGLNFGGVLALTNSGASTGNSTGARLSESYGPYWNLGDGATWHYQIVNGSLLVGISAGGTNYGSGNIRASGEIYARTNSAVLHLDNYSSYALPLSGGTVTGIAYFQTNNGGKSGATDSAKLQAYSTGNNSAFMSFHKSGHFAVNFGLDDDNVMRLGGWSAAANRMQLDMSGNVTFAGDVTAYSDSRVKTNVKTIESALEKTLKLRGVSYNRTDSDDKSTKIGVIAQEILDVIPEVVNQDNDGMYNVSYGNITALLIEAIKEQQAQIDELKAKLDGLTK